MRPREALDPWRLGDEGEFEHHNSLRPLAWRVLLSSQEGGGFDAWVLTPGDFWFQVGNFRRRGAAERALRSFLRDVQA